MAPRRQPPRHIEALQEEVRSGFRDIVGKVSEVAENNVARHVETTNRLTRLETLFVSILGSEGQPGRLGVVEEVARDAKALATQNAQNAAALRGKLFGISAAVSFIVSACAAFWKMFHKG